tara:strand:- start:284 stop:487 length:204 start_codon:yes stop_codon:yes gene_type:complete
MKEEEAEAKEFYNLNLHECITLPCDITVMRVPSGWLYDMWDSELDKPKNGVFVPFDNNFQRTKTRGV